MISKTTLARFNKFANKYVAWFGGKKPIMTHDGKIIIPKNEFSSESTFHSLQAAIDNYAHAFTVD